MHRSARYGITGWRGIAGSIATQQEWLLWAQDQCKMHSRLSRVQLATIPTRIRRRLDVLGQCVMFVCEQCIPLIETEPAVIFVSRHGDITSTEKLIQCVRDHIEISPTAFTYSVHNRFSSLLSMVAGYHGVNAAYSSVRDGFPLALAEAVDLLATRKVLQVLVVAYEPEIPETYQRVISQPWSPHVVAFVLQKADDIRTKYSLVRHTNSDSVAVESGSCLPLMKCLLNKRDYRDGFWEHRYGE